MNLYAILVEVAFFIWDKVYLRWSKEEFLLIALPRNFFSDTRDALSCEQSFFWSSKKLGETYFSHSGTRDVKNIRRENETFSEILTYIFLIKTLMTTFGEAKCKHLLSIRVYLWGLRVNENNFGILKVSL